MGDRGLGHSRGLRLIAFAQAHSIDPHSGASSFAPLTPGFAHPRFESSPAIRTQKPECVASGLKYSVCVYCTKSEPIFKTKDTSVPRALRASVRSTELLLQQKCGKTLNTKRTRFCESNFLGKGFRKISADSF